MSNLGTRVEAVCCSSSAPRCQQV